ncbi:MAG TPA: glycosyltransferase family 2 protein [Candidatus Binatia bacterium]|nr:glycosyltransferase family 2 protein [Candidatus Binatia bacterium]
MEAIVQQEQVPKLSVVVPVYRGEATVGPLVDRLIAALATKYPLEIVLVNDASPDASERACLELAQRYPRTVVYAAMARNFGEHNTVMTGLRLATGDLIVTMDDDLQNPPEEVEKLVAEAKRGFDAVYARFERKEHSWFRNLGSRFNDRVATLLLGKPHDLYLSTFRTLSRFLVDEITRYQGPFPYVDSLVLRTTDSISSVVVRHEPRAVDTSGYNLAKLVAVWLNMTTSASILPLRVTVVLGLGIAALGGLLGIWVVIEKIFWPDNSVGWTSLMTALVIFSGMQLVLMGAIGEYVGRVLLTANGMPQGVLKTLVRNGAVAPAGSAVAAPSAAGRLRSAG